MRLRNGKGVENGRAAGVVKCGEDLEFSGMRKENVLSKAVQGNVARENPETCPLQVFPRFSPQLNCCDCNGMTALH